MTRTVAALCLLATAACVATVDTDEAQMIATNATECRQVYNTTVAQSKPDAGVAMIGPLIAVGGVMRVGDASPDPVADLAACYERVGAPPAERIMP